LITGPNPDHLDELGTRPVMVMATLHLDGRPQLSLVRPWFHDNVAEITLTDARVKTRNLRADPRAALLAAAEDGQRFVVAEGQARLSAVSTEPGDETSQALARLYRALAGEHHDWDDYQHAMVRDRRLLAVIEIEHTYTGGTHT
jgi:PPOX class probable F420-dependent enzyme